MIEKILMPKITDGDPRGQFRWEVCRMLNEIADVLNRTMICTCLSTEGWTNEDWLANDGRTSHCALHGRIRIG